MSVLSNSATSNPKRLPNGSTTGGEDGSRDFSPRQERPPLLIYLCRTPSPPHPSPQSLSHTPLLPSPTAFLLVTPWHTAPVPTPSPLPGTPRQPGASPPLPFMPPAHAPPPSLPPPRLQKAHWVGGDLAGPSLHHKEPRTKGTGRALPLLHAAPSPWGSHEAAGPPFPHSSLLSTAGTLPWSFLSQPPSHRTHQGAQS